MRGHYGDVIPHAALRHEFDGEAVGQVVDVGLREVLVHG